MFRRSILWFCCKFSKEIFFPPTETPTSQILSLSWYLLVQLLHLPLKFHLSKLSRNEKPFWIPSQNSEYPRIFRVTGANQNARKLLSTDLVITNRDYNTEDKTAIGDKIVDTLYSNRVTTQRTKESTASSPVHSKLGCLLFSIGSSNCGITLHGGDGGGKALFSPLEVSKVSESPSRAKCLN